MIKKELEKVMQLRWEEELGSEWVKVLGVEWRLTSDSIQCRAPTKYMQDLLVEWRSEKCKAAATPMVKTKVKNDEDIELEWNEHRRYRRAIGKLMWLLNWRPDGSFAIKELSRKASKPTRTDLAKLKWC